MEDFDRITYRAVYTVNFPGAICVLHVFQKKSKRGIRTPRVVIDLVRSRLSLAEKHHRQSQRDEDPDG